MSFKFNDGSSTLPNNSPYSSASPTDQLRSRSGSASPTDQLRSYPADRIRHLVPEDAAIIDMLRDAVQIGLSSIPPIDHYFPKVPSHERLSWASSPTRIPSFVAFTTLPSRHSHTAITSPTLDGALNAQGLPNPRHSLAPELTRSPSGRTSYHASSFLSEQASYPGQRTSYQSERTCYLSQRNSSLKERTNYPIEKTSNHYERSIYPSERASYPSEPTCYQAGRTNYPGEHSNYLGEQTNYSSGRTSYPGERTSYPNVRTSYPGEPNNYSSVRTNFPNEQTNYPSARASNPSGQACFQAEFTAADGSVWLSSRATQGGSKTMDFTFLHRLKSSEVANPLFAGNPPLNPQPLSTGGQGPHVHTSTSGFVPTLNPSCAGARSPSAPTSPRYTPQPRLSQEASSASFNRSSTPILLSPTPSTHRARTPSPIRTAPLNSPSIHVPHLNHTSAPSTPRHQGHTSHTLHLQQVGPNTNGSSLHDFCNRGVAFSADRAGSVHNAPAHKPSSFISASTYKYTDYSYNPYSFRRQDAYGAKTSISPAASPHVSPPRASPPHAAHTLSPRASTPISQPSSPPGSPYSTKSHHTTASTQSATITVTFVRTPTPTRSTPTASGEQVSMTPKAPLNINVELSNSAAQRLAAGPIPSMSERSAIGVGGGSAGGSSRASMQGGHDSRTVRFASSVVSPLEEPSLTLRGVGAATRSPVRNTTLWPEVKADRSMSGGGMDAGGFGGAGGIPMNSTRYGHSSPTPPPRFSDSGALPAGFTPGAASPWEAISGGGAVPLRYTTGGRFESPGQHSLYGSPSTSHPNSSAGGAPSYGTYGKTERSFSATAADVFGSPRPYSAAGSRSSSPPLSPSWRSSRCNALSSGTVALMGGHPDTSTYPATCTAAVVGALIGNDQPPPQHRLYMTAPTQPSTNLGPGASEQHMLVYVDPVPPSNRASNISSCGEEDFNMFASAAAAAAAAAVARAALASGNNPGATTGMVNATPCGSSVMGGSSGHRISDGRGAALAPGGASSPQQAAAAVAAMTYASVARTLAGAALDAGRGSTGMYANEGTTKWGSY